MKRFEDMTNDEKAAQLREIGDTVALAVPPGANFVVLITTADNKIAQTGSLDRVDSVALLRAAADGIEKAMAASIGDRVGPPIVLPGSSAPQ